MNMYRDTFGTFDTVYLGGGTPSILSLHHIEKILNTVQKNFILSSDTEITLEANPTDLTTNVPTSLIAMGVNRLSIGVQSFDKRVLTFLGRRHTAREARSALENARRAGFTNIGTDLIYGIPGQSIDQWKDTLDETLIYTPEHLSCYELTVAPETPLGRQQRTGTISLPGQEHQYALFITTSEVLEKAGYIHYEISNFAKNMKVLSRHNQKYWYHAPYLGLGPAAHSFAGNRRWWNHRSLSRYCTDTARGRRPVAETERLTTEQLRLEAFSLGLRTKSGINVNDFYARYNYDILLEKKHIVRRLMEEGFVEVANGRLYPTRHGMAIADSLSQL